VCFLAFAAMLGANTVPRLDSWDAAFNLAQVVQVFKLPAFFKLTKTDPFAAWFVVTGDATPDGIRVVRLVLGAISSLPIFNFVPRLDSWDEGGLQLRPGPTHLYGPYKGVVTSLSGDRDPIRPKSGQMSFVRGHDTLRFLDSWDAAFNFVQVPKGRLRF